MNEEKKLEGLEGGLFIFAVVMTLGLSQAIVDILSDFTSVSDVSWDDLLDMLLFAIPWGFTAFLFFSKKRAFPKVFIGVLIFWQFVGLLALLDIQPDNSIFDSDEMKDFIETLPVTTLLVLYMLMSKRVKATFVK